jgi:hypothetical protein
MESSGVIVVTVPWAAWMATRRLDAELVVQQALQQFDEGSEGLALLVGHLVGAHRDDVGLAERDESLTGHSGPSALRVRPSFRSPAEHSGNPARSTGCSDHPPVRDQVIVFDQVERDRRRLGVVDRGHVLGVGRDRRHQPAADQDGDA